MKFLERNGLNVARVSTDHLYLMNVTPKPGIVIDDLGTYYNKYSKYLRVSNYPDLGRVAPTALENSASPSGGENNRFLRFRKQNIYEFDFQKPKFDFFS